MVNFNDSKDTYRETIEESVSFSGQSHDFFIAAKADLLNKIVREKFSHLPKVRVLDVGCGHGYLHGYLPKENFEIVGVDVADEVLDLAKETNPEVSYISHDGETLPFDSESFDIALAVCVMHHVPPHQWNSFLEEMNRVVKNKGVVVIFEHNPYNPLTQYIVANNVLDEGVVLLKNSDLEKRMIQSGFSSAKSNFFLFTPFSSSFFRWLDSKLGWLPLGAQYYTVATREA